MCVAVPALWAAWVIARRRSARWRSVIGRAASTVSHMSSTTSNRSARPERSTASASPILACTMARSRKSSEDERGTLTLASSTNSSIAGAGDAQPDAAEATAREVEPVHAVHRPGDARAQIERRERALVGHEEVGDLDVVAAGAPQAADVPGVDDAGDRLRIEVGDPHLLIAVGPQPGLVAVEDLAGAVQRRRVHAAAGKEPVPGDPIAALHGDGAAPRVR